MNVEYAAEERAALSPTSFAIIIGGMKCGTTSLFELLAQHPQICPSREKEPHFFAEEADPTGSWDRYLALWDWHPDRDRVALEASTSYAKHPWVKGVPDRIRSSPGGSFRFIYMVRDPVKRIASQVRHGVYGGWGHSLDEGLTDDLLDFSRYAMQADRYADVFGRDSLLILTLEELRDAPDAVLRRTCEFLGVDPDHRFVAAGEPRNVGVFYTVPGPVAWLARNRVAKGMVKAALPRDARHRLRQWLARLGGRREKVVGRWKLDADEVTLVRERLASDLERLRDEYGVVAPWLPARSEGEASVGR